MQASLNQLLFVVLPYAAFLLFTVGAVERYRRHRASVTSLSSQFFESRRHFWALMPFHLGLLAVLAAHLVWMIAPAVVQRWNADPTRMQAVEIAALAFGLTAFGGYIAVGLRRAADPKLRVVTTMADWSVYGLLLVQIVLGILVAVRYSWGSGWFVTIASPYLWSLVRFNPDTAAIAALPPLVRAHVVVAWLLLAIFPFSRLVHVLSVPNPYLWRRPQVVRWRRAVAVITGDRS